MPLPAAAQKKADAANELLRKAADARTAAPQPADTPKLAPVAAAQTPPTPAASVDVATLQRQLTDTQANLEKRNLDFAALQRKLDLEGPRAAADLRAAREALKAAEKARDEAQAKLEQRVESGEVTSLTEADRQLAGPELVKVMSKVAREVSGQVTDAAVKPLMVRVGEFERMSDEGFILTLDTEIPSWRVQNDDPGFNGWLDLVDPVTQKQRRDLLLRAEAAKMGNRIVEIFRAFTEGREIGALKPVPDPLEVRLNPPQGGSSDPNAALVDAAGKKIWTQLGIKQFYDAIRKGEYRDKQVEARTQEQDIFAAYREGRVRS